MSSENIIQIENITKTFKIYQKPVDRLKEVLFFWSKKKRFISHQALKGITFNVKKGEFLGILGGNGAGKSTLLKIISNVMTPSSGKCVTRGTVSLLQLGLGFDKELTGEQNAIFACKMMEMNQAETKKAIEEIKEFSEIGDFFYCPIKTYSSGMNSRLLFSVAINTKPDILIVDEVLSVGDIKFSQKCLRHLHWLKENGATVLMVTHNIALVKTFCDRAMWIFDGKVNDIGEAKVVCEKYESYMLHGTNKAKNSKDTPQKKNVQYTDNRIELLSSSMLFDGEDTNQISGSEKVSLDIKFKSLVPFEELYYSILIKDKRAVPIVHIRSDLYKNTDLISEDNNDFSFHSEFTLPSLNVGDYSISFGVNISKEVSLRSDFHHPFSVVQKYAGDQVWGIVYIKDATHHIVTPQ